MTRTTKKKTKRDTVTLKVADVVGDFAEDKGWAAAIREEAIRKTLTDGGNIILDFTGVTLTTQSFVHALISDILRSEGEKILDKIEFRGCVAGVKGIVETVVQYSLETMEDDETNDIGKKTK
jgi:uncharacterized protein DUF4325